MAEWNNQSTGGLRSNTGRERSRGGWRGPSDDTNWRTRGGDRRNNRRNFDQESGYKKIPSNKVGRIIGKGGCKIRELEYESEAKIKIGDSSGNETTITLFGSPFAILSVHGMINLLIKKEEDWLPQINCAEVQELIKKRFGTGDIITRKNPTTSS